MIRRVYLFLVILLLSSVFQAQNIQLFAEDFNSGSGATFTLNRDTNFPNTGDNQWIINNQFSGVPLYGNTIAQDSIAGGGTISGAPFSRYLHIHDTKAALSNNVANANWDPNSASDVFAAITDPICTKAITDVKLSFFWLCEGSADAYGEVYYSRNGGPWIKTGANKYWNQDRWKYEVVQNPAFDDVQALRFGFRWINTTGGTTNTSMAIDEVIVVGTYDQVNNPIQIDITTVIPNPVCRGSNVIVFADLSDSVCAGTYRFFLSEPGGSFNNATNLGVLTLNSAHNRIGVALGIPPMSAEDTCYRIRIDRIAPLPRITGEVSICFEVEDCPNVITTRQPIVLVNPLDTICTGSVIDVPFNSTGVYNQTNVYTAELSDSNGSFANPFIIGSIPDPNAYPAFPPGNVSGLIPTTVPPGCGYYIRVNSNNPVAVGSLYGPFCIRDCDITTNERIDIAVCIDESTSATDTIEVDVNTWNQNQQYFLGNTFNVEVRSSMTFGLVNVGGLGAVVDTADTSIIITIPPLGQLLSLGIAPGMYYIRVVADNSANTWDMLGSLVRLTIGAPSETPATVFPLDSVYCFGDVGGFGFAPVNPQSEYEWQSPSLNNGQPFIWPGNQLLINLSGFAGTLRARVREINFGCYGPWSNYAEFVVITPPDVDIRPGSNACLGDTVTYSVNFLAETFYEWELAGGGKILDTTNNVLTVVWDSLGTFLMQLEALNKCGLDFGFNNVTVYPYPEIDLEDEVTICAGESVTLTGPDSMPTYFWLRGTSIVSRDQTFTFTPTQNITYELFVENEGGCQTRDTITIILDQSTATEDTVELCRNQTVRLGSGFPGDATFEWSTGETTDSITVDEAGIYTVQIFRKDEPCVDEKTIEVVEVGCGYVLEVPNAFTPNGDALNDRFELLGYDFELVYFRVYNRWGELLFETNDPNQSWDGTFQGEPAELGVYTWTVIFLDDQGDQQIESGNVTLIR